MTDIPFGAPCWVDVFTSDPDRTREFYAHLFGWTSESAGQEYGGYINFFADGQQVAGGMRNDGQSGTPDVWSIYLATEDVQKTAELAAAHGGQIIVPAMQVGEMGSMLVLADAGGAVVGAWQPGSHKGFAVLAQPGAPAWFELHTRDYDTAVAFYRDVFHWDTHVMSDTPEFRYTTLGKDDDAKAGIMDSSVSMPKEVPPHWRVYFATENTDAAVQQVAELGGSVIQPPQDTPYGRLALVSDPTGAIFALMADS